MGFRRIIELIKAIMVIWDPDILKDDPDPDKNLWIYK